MKKRLLKLLLLVVLIGLPHISGSGSYFSSQQVISGNSFTTACWSLPSVPVLISPTDGTVANSVWLQNPVMDWSDSTSSCPNAGQIVYQYESFYDPGLTQLAYSSIWLTGSFIPAPGTPDGTYYWHVRAMDTVGNTSGWSEVWKMTVDTKAPAVPTGIYFKDTVNNKDVACGGVTSARNFDVYWDANTKQDFDHYEYISFNADGSTGPIRTFTTPYFNASWWTVPTEGTYGVQIRAVDKAGNKSDWFGGIQGISNSCQYTVDWTAPTTPGPIGWTIENPPVGLDYVAGTDFDKFATCSGAVNYSPMSNIWKLSTDATTITYEREVYSPIDTLIYSDSPLVSYVNGTAPSEATYWVQIRARDAAGNYSNWTPKCSVTYDVTKPKSVITSPDNKGSNSIIYSTSWDGTIAGTATDDRSGVNHVDLSVHRASDSAYWNGSSWIAGSETTVRVTTTGTANWTYTVTDHSVPTTYTITSHSVDNAGNIENSYILTIVLPISTPTITPIPSPTSETSPTTTPTAEPSLIPKLSPSPSLTPDPTSISTPSPSTMPTLSPSSEPSSTVPPEPSLSPSPQPTSTPAPTPDPTSISTPSPSPTSELLTSGIA